MIRILHIVANMNRGGIENFLMNVYRAINREKVQFDFLVTRNVVGAFDQEIEAKGGKIYHIPVLGEVGARQYKQNLRVFFQNCPYTIIHVHRDALGGIYLKEARKAGVAIRIAHSHSSKIGEPLTLTGMVKASIKTWYKYQLRREATHYFACSKVAGRWLFGQSVNKPIYYIPNGINLQDYTYNEVTRKAVRKQYGLASEHFVIGNVSRFYYPKNHQFLIEVFSQVVKRIPDSRLVLVGEGELETAIRQQVSDLGIEAYVQFLGVLEDVGQVLSAFDLFVLPSRYEGLPLTLVEAQTSGLACLVSDKITSEATLDAQLVQNLSITDADVWVKQIEKAYEDRKIRKATRRSQSQVLKGSQYDIQEITGELEKIYECL